MLDQRQLEHFRREYWTRTTFLATIAPSDFQALHEELAGFDPAALLGRHGGAVASVWFEDGDGHAQAVDMAPVDALKFYTAGMTVFVPDVKTPTLERWRVDLARALERPPANMLTSLFLSKGGNVSGGHFDHIENFTVQLRGTKTWRIMANRHAPRPTVNYSMRTDRPYLEELWLYSERPLPVMIGDDAERVTVAPGSVLYVPRGHWHDVEAAGDSVSVLLGFPAWTWLDVVLPALRTLLLRRPEWRENAVYPHSAESRRAAHRRLAPLCRELANLLEALDPADLLPPAPNAPDGTVVAEAEYRRNFLCTLGIYPARDGVVDLVASVHHGDLSRRREARVPAAWIPLLEVVDRSSQISHRELARRHPELADDLAPLLNALVGLDVIRPVSTVFTGGDRQTGTVIERAS